MATRAERARLGVFMILATVGFLAAVGTLAGLKLWNPRDHYFIRYKESISGLDVGSAVKMQGVQVGRVDKVEVESGDVVRVSLALEPGTPVTRDTHAVLSSLGITGIKFIELTGGKKGSSRLRPNGKRSEIQAGASMTHTLTGKAIDVSQKVEHIADNLILLTDEATRTRVQSLLTHVDEVATSLAAILQQDRVRRIMAHVDQTTTALARAATLAEHTLAKTGPRLEEAVAASANAAAALNRIAQKTHPQAALAEVQNAARALRQRIESPAITQALDALKTVSLTVRSTSTEISSAVHRNDRQLGRLWSLLNAVALNLRSFSESIKERPSLLLRGETVKERHIP